MEATGDHASHCRELLPCCGEAEGIPCRPYETQAVTWQACLRLRVWRLDAITDIIAYHRHLLNTGEEGSIGASSNPCGAHWSQCHIKPRMRRLYCHDVHPLASITRFSAIGHAWACGVPRNIVSWRHAYRPQQVRGRHSVLHSITHCMLYAGPWQLNIVHYSFRCLGAHLMMSSTLRIISAASVADNTTCALTYVSHQCHVISFARQCAPQDASRPSKC